MRIILHIGVSKTGTTTIQNCLETHAPSFKEIYYPSSKSLYGTAKGNHLLLPLLSNAKLVWKTNFALKLLDSLIGTKEIFNEDILVRSIHSEIKACLAYAQEKGCKTVLFSNEHLSDRLNDQDIIRFSKRISPFFESKKIIIYLRRQDYAFLSLYSESLKHGNTEKFEEFIACNEVAQLVFDYERIIKRWLECGWSVTPRIYYEQHVAPPSWSLIKDFLDIISDDTFTQLSGLNIQSLNRSPNYAGLEIIRIINKSKRNIPISMFNSLHKASYKFHRNRSGIPLCYKQMFGDIMKKYLSGNRWVAKNFFGRDNLFL